MTESEDIFTNQLLELRRGSIVLAVLSTLREPRYGYGLLQALKTAGVAVDAGTLYPLLRRLEKQGMLMSEWSTADNRPRKYYRLSDQGYELYGRLRDEWLAIQTNVQALIQED